MNQNNGYGQFFKNNNYTDFQRGDDMGINTFLQGCYAEICNDTVS
jgi:hypothetical protein